ncbi:MAG: exosome complex RNA-binding protein Csl4 [Candidatus Micrarchaeota archaeon]
MEKKLVLPGDHLSSAEESETGENTYSERDEVFASGVGEDASVPGHAKVKTRSRTLKVPAVGDALYCLIIKAGMNKAIGGCVPVGEVESGERGIELEAVLPVTAVRRDYVRDMRDEVKVGDIVKARIMKVEKSGYEISMNGPDCGVVCAFCPRCRSRMDLKERTFICPECSWKERRKLPLAEGEAPPPEEPRERRFGGFRGRGGFRERGGGRGGFGERRRFGRRPGPGGRSGSY